MVNRTSRIDNLIVKRGDVFYANLVGYGCVQGGLRPVVIISNDTNNKFSNIVQIVPLTSQLKKCDLPVHVYISEIKGVLTKDSLALVEQIQTIDKSSLESKKGSLPTNIIDKICAAIRIQFGFAA